MEWRVETTEEWRKWWSSLPESFQDEVAAVVGLLRAIGPDLPFPYSSSIRGARLARLRELRIQAAGRPLRTLYAFDPRRVAVLLIGGEKTGNKRWYRRAVPEAEHLYTRHLARLKKVGLIP